MLINRNASVLLKGQQQPRGGNHLDMLTFRQFAARLLCLPILYTLAMLPTDLPVGPPWLDDGSQARQPRQSQHRPEIAREPPLRGAWNPIPRQ